MLSTSTAGRWQVKSFGKHVAGLRQRALGGVDQQENSVDHRQRSLDLATEVGMTGSVDQVDAGALPHHRGGLGEDRDSSFALLVGRVHDPVDPGFVRCEDTGGSEHRIDQGGLAVVDVRDQRQVAKGMIVRQSAVQNR